MKNIVESIKQLFAYKKSMIAILVIVSILMTSGTFSYWAINVQGNLDETSMTFRIGEYITTLFDFILQDESIPHLHKVDVEYLLEDYEVNQNDVVFGIVWDDPTLSEEFKDQIINGNIEVSYGFKFFKNGIEVSNRIERQLNRLIQLKVDNNNPYSITYDDSAESFKFYTYANSKKKLTEVQALLEYEVYVEITYTIGY